MKLLLVLCDSNWADEFDLNGFALYTDNAWKEYLKLVKEKIFYKKREWAEYGINVSHVGTNQAQPYEDFNSFKDDFKTKKITEAEAKWLCTTFNVSITEEAKCAPNAYGMFMYLDPYYEDCDETPA